MCGITGFFRAQGIDEGREVIERMTQSLTHRGPDEEGFHCDALAHLGSRRLSIVDLDSGTQPIYSEDGRLCIVFNGEIYNFQKLRQRLQAFGVNFRTESDTEVALQAYRIWGPRCLTRFQGMFALAIWDQKHKQLFLARDRMGIKPLYYAQLADGSFAFGSEIRAILKHPQAEAKLYHNAIDNLFTYGFNVAPNTFYEGIRQILPGHFALVSEQGMKQEEYWDIDLDQEMLGDRPEEIGHLLKDYLEQSVKDRFSADVPVAAYLSGGIDSSSVVGLYQKQKSAPVKTLTITFEQGTYDEREHSREVSEHFGTDNEEFVCSLSQEEVVEAVDHMEEPLVTLLNIPLYLLAKKTKQAGYKAVLTGDGADELFGGYDYFRWLKSKTFIDRRPSPFRQNILRKSFPSLKNAAAAQMQYHYFTEQTDRYPINYPAIPYQFQQLPVKDQLYSADLKNILDNNYMDDPFCFDVQKIAHRSLMDQALYIESKMRLLNMTLPLADKMSMAHGVELRPVFLDHDFVNFAFRIPDHLKVQALREKHIFKQSMKGFLPSSICTRKKQPLLPPERWFLKQCPDLIQEHLNSPAIEQTGYFDPAFVQMALKAYRDPTSRIDYSGLLVVILFMQIWHQRCLS